jgi:hypothetical protein
LGFDGTRVIGIGYDGSSEIFTDQPCTGGKKSPDSQWILLDYPGLQLFSGEGRYVKTIYDNQVNAYFWQPDSKGIFYITEGFYTKAEGLYYASVPDGKSILIEACQPVGWGCNFEYAEGDYVWIQDMGK